MQGIEDEGDRNLLE